MPRREFEDDFGMVGEMLTYGSLMPVMEGRRADYARIKQLKSNGLWERLEAANRLYGEVHEEWTAVYGTPSAKKTAQQQIDKRPNTETPTCEDAIKEIVDRFLAWKLPEDFNPDCGISFKKTFNEDMPFGPMKYEPHGTNLFDAKQAESMIGHILRDFEVVSKNHSHEHAERATVSSDGEG